MDGEEQKKLNEQLISAVIRGELSDVQEAIQNGAQVDAQNRIGCTGLHYAAELSNVEIAQYLLAQKASVKIVDERGRTALYLAAREGSLAIVKMLVEGHHADINAKNNHGEAALHVAARNGFTDVIAFLIECGAPINDINVYDYSPLMLAALEDRKETTSYLIKKGADIYLGNGIGSTALHLAAYRGHVEVTEVLIEEAHADYERKNESGNTPFMVACESGYYSVASFLLEKGANKYALNNDKRSAFHLAAELGREEVVKMLVDDYDINVKDRCGFVPLTLACRYGHYSVAVILLKKGADPNTVTSNQWTALHYACTNGHVDIVELLCCQYGANVHVVDNSGRTPLVAAQENGHESIVKFLNGFISDK